MARPDQLTTNLVKHGLLRPGEAETVGDVASWLAKTKGLPRAILRQLEAGEAPRLGRYAITGQLGQGGMGMVLRGRDPALGREVAIKVLPQGADEQHLARLRAEAQAMAKLRHANVVGIYGLEEAEGLTLLVMELVDGSSFDDRLDEGGPLEEDEAWRLLEQVVGALAHAEEIGVIHRDLKPGNIMWQPGEGGGIYRVCDFGLARDMGTDESLRLTKTGTALGTPLYSSPEQLTGSKDLDQRTDMYAVGLTLYEALTGTVPGDEAESYGELVGYRLRNAIPDVRELNPDVSPKLARLLADLTASEREDRPASWSEVQGRLRRRTREAPLARRGSRRTAVAPPGGLSPVVLPVAIGACALLAVATALSLAVGPDDPPAADGALVETTGPPPDDPPPDDPPPDDPPPDDPPPPASQRVDPVDDPYFRSAGTLQKKLRDQWGLQAIGLGEPVPGWPATGEPVVVALVDTGVDFEHPELRGQQWVNEDEVPGNGEDDDGNGYVDDRFGYDFAGQSPDVSDPQGQGTFMAGIVAARTGNGAGIAGVAPGAKIMALRVSGRRGGTRSSFGAQAITYAANNGARVIVLGFGPAGRPLTRIEAAAVRHAHGKGVLIVAPAGNEAADLSKTPGFPSLPEVLTVGPLGPGNKRSPYGSYGAVVALAAPADETLSLRAQGTDLLRLVREDYTAGASFIGDEQRYYRCGGSAFAAAFVAGAAAQVLSHRPELTLEELRRVLLHSARDVETAGIDNYSGYGIVDVPAALAADPSFYVEARIDSVAVLQSPTRGLQLQVKGTADADAFAGARLSVGEGEEPSSWTGAAEIPRAVTSGVLAALPSSAITSKGVWLLRLDVDHRGGRTRTHLFKLDVE